MQSRIKPYPSDSIPWPDGWLGRCALRLRSSRARRLLGDNGSRNAFTWNGIGYSPRCAKGLWHSRHPDYRGTPRRISRRRC